MMILQKIKKNYHNLSTRFNYNFSYIYKYKMYERNNYISYDYIILLMTECYTYKKNYLFFLRKKFYKIWYNHNLIEDEMFEFIGDSLFWLYRKENMFDFFNDFKSLYYFAHFDLFAIKNIFLYYNFFFNMYINKHVFKKIYSLYKSVHLSEFLCKHYYPFEINYFINNINTVELIFDSFYYYYPVVFFLKDTNNLSTNFLEFFPLKNSFSKNKFYIYTNCHINFTKTYNRNQLFKNVTEIDKNNFIVYKWLSVDNKIYNDYFFNKKKFNFYIFSKKYEKIQYLYIYKIFILLFYFVV